MISKVTESDDVLICDGKYYTGVAWELVITKYRITSLVSGILLLLHTIRRRFFSFSLLCCSAISTSDNGKPPEGTLRPRFDPSGIEGYVLVWHYLSDAPRACWGISKSYYTHMCRFSCFPTSYEIGVFIACTEQHSLRSADVDFYIRRDCIEEICGIRKHPSELRECEGGMRCERGVHMTRSTGRTRTRCLSPTQYENNQHGRVFPDS